MQVEKRCKTCAYFLLPNTWVGSVLDNGNQQGICEYPTPAIPRIIAWSRKACVGEDYTGCPTWASKP